MSGMWKKTAALGSYATFLPRMREESYEKYGCYREDVMSLTLKGLDGVARIAAIMKGFRENTPETFFCVILAEPPPVMILRVKFFQFFPQRQLSAAFRTFVANIRLQNTCQPNGNASY